METRGTRLGEPIGDVDLGRRVGGCGADEAHTQDCTLHWCPVPSTGATYLYSLYIYANNDQLFDKEFYNGRVADKVGHNLSPRFPVVMQCHSEVKAAHACRGGFEGVRITRSGGTM